MKKKLKKYTFIYYAPIIRFSSLTTFSCNHMKQNYYENVNYHIILLLLNHQKTVVPAGSVEADVDVDIDATADC